MKKVMNDKQINSLLVEKIISKKLIKINDANIKKIYNKARNFYNSGKYKDAQTLFSTLILFERNNPIFLYGFAACSFLSNDIDLALDAFFEYAILVPDDPLPYYYISNCFEKKNDPRSAAIAMQTVIERAGNQAKYQELKHLAQLAVSSFARQASVQKTV